MGTSRKTGASIAVQKVTWAHMVRDVVIEAMNNGQLVPILMGGLAFVALLKMPSADVTLFLNRTLDLVKNYSAVGYMGWVGTLIVWFFHARAMRATHNEESGRIGREKSRLQEALSGKKLPSSRS